MRPIPRLAFHGWAGLGLVALFWPLNWFLPGVRTAYLFFPLWLGYILTVDAMVYWRSGTSQWKRSRLGFCLLFVASAPGWWLFEMINWRTKNWEYVGAGHFSDVEYFLLATISFSTVMPAVFETAELIRTFRWVERFASGPRLRLKGPGCWRLLAAGLAMLALTLAWPRICYPLVWGSIFLILEPINVWLRRPNFLDSLERGDWRPLAALSIGALACGFCWELWNFHSYPKWVYHTPGVEFLYIFEMPLLGYLGYLPFAWELFALRSAVWPNAPKLRI